MLDFLRNLRLKQLFGGADEPQPTFPGMGDMFNPTPDPTQGGIYDVGQRMSQLYNPETTSIDRFNKLIGQYPQEPKPGLGRKILGGTLGALTNLNDIYDVHGRPTGKITGRGEDVFNQITGKSDYTQKIADWKSQIEPTEKAANIERQSNANERIMAHQQVADELRQQAQDAKEKNDLRKADIAEKRASIYEFKAKNPQMKLIIPKGGNIIAMNPITGEQHDTGIDSGSMNEMDKLNLTQEGAMAKIEGTGEQARKTEEVKQAGRESIAETRGWKIYNVPDGQGGQKAVKINEVSGEVKDLSEPVGAVTTAGVGGGTKAELPTQTRVRQYNAARELYNTRPDLRPFLKFGSPGTNDFQVAPPGKNFFGNPSGPTPEQYKTLQDTIYGKSEMMPSHKQGGTTQPTAPTAPKGWKYVPKPGGGWTAVPDTGKVGG